MLHWILSRLKATIRLLEKKVVTELSKMLVREEIAENSTVYFDASIDGNELAYRVEKNGGLVNASTGEKFDILIGVKNDCCLALFCSHIEVRTELDDLRDTIQPLLMRAADLHYGSLQEIEVALTKAEGNIGANSMVTEEAVGSEQIAEGSWARSSSIRSGGDERRRTVLDVLDVALDVVLTESYDLVYGARPIRRWLEKKVVTEL
ncbi:hypothetical protein MKX03_015320 [Papaver bracteatum]|nr:hypothetical protein MKX03_015320 [Papaver bracteatum]